MRLSTIVLLTLATKLGVASGQHVHFKIHVPEIIQHHLHTRTIFIRVHEPKKKVAKKTAHSESFRNDWSHYGKYDERGRGKFSSIKQSKDHGEIRQEGSPAYGSELDNSYGNYDRWRDEKTRLEFVGHPATVPIFPRYEVRENIVEDAPIDSGESYRDSREEIHRKRKLSESGHSYTKESNNFFDDEREESGESISFESGNEIDESNARDDYRYEVGDDYTDTTL